MGGKTEIKQTRRSTFRPLNQMNGDYLTNLKRPRCSEIEGTVKGMNQAKLSDLKKRLDLWYRERNLTLGKMQRGQDEVYGVLLKVNKEKKKLQRQAYKMQQEESRSKFEKKKGQDADILTVVVDPPAEEIKPPPTGVPNGLDAISNVRKANAASGRKRATQPSKKTIPSSKVLEVKKDNLLEPLVRERSLSDPKDMEKENSTLSQFSDIRDTLDGRVLYDFDEEKENDMKDQKLPPLAKRDIKPKSKTKRSNAGMPTITESSWSPERWASDKSPAQHESMTRQSVSNPAGCVVVLNRSTVSETDALINKRQWSDGDIRLRTDNNNKVPSLVELNKKKAKQRERKRKEILDREDFTTYTKNKRGEIIPADCPFKRKDFEPPSMRENHFRRKMLDAQVEARDQQREKLEGFFDKINAADREKANRLRDAKRQAAAAAEAEEDARRQARSKGTFSMSISQMMQVFAQSSLPDGIEPGSYEALKYCAYIRNHSPLTQDERQAAVQKKVSSWGHAINE